MSEKKEENDKKRHGIMLPKGLVDLIDEIVANYPEFRTRSDFVVKAIQNMVLEYRKLFPEKFGKKEEKQKGEKKE